jgi:hypothetical protein
MARLRACIDRSPMKGDAAGFAARAEGLKRALGAEIPVARAEAPASDPKRELGMRHYDVAPMPAAGSTRSRGPERGR